MIKSSSFKYLLVLALGISLLAGFLQVESTSGRENENRQTQEKNLDNQKSEDVLQELETKYKDLMNTFSNQEKNQEKGVKYSQAKEKLNELSDVIKNKLSSKLPKEAQPQLQALNNLINRINKVIIPLSAKNALTDKAVVQEIQRYIGIKPADGIPGDSTQSQIDKFLKDNLAQLGHKINEVSKPSQADTPLPSPSKPPIVVDLPQDKSVALSYIAIFFSVLSTLASMYALYELWKRNPASDQSAQNGSQSSVDQSTNSQSSQERVTRAEFEQMRAEFEQMRAELLEHLRAELPQRIHENDFRNHPQTNRKEGIVTPSSQISPRSQEPPDTKLLEAYNRDPGSLSNHAIEVSAIEDSINQRRLGSDQKVVLEKVRRGQGNYWVLPLSGKSFNYLVPKKGMKINEFNYETVEALFLCENYQSGDSNFQLCKPGKVAPLSQGETWQLMEQGQLRF